MAIEKISDAARDAASVGAMADRPNSTARDGYSGLTPAQVKAKFDALPKLNTAKINEIIDLINGTGASSLAYLLQTPVEYQGDTLTLYELLVALQNGTFGDIAMIDEATLTETLAAINAAIAAANKIPPGGTAGQILAKASGSDYDLMWVDDQRGGGEIDYNDLSNKPSINGTQLVGNKTENELILEARGKITVNDVEYLVQRKAMTITNNGVTTTFYVADITGA